MSIAVIGWQIFIFVTIFISERNRGWVAAFWVLWTLVQVYALPLSVIQFLTIFLGYKLAGSDQGKEPAAQDSPRTENSEAKSMRAQSSKLDLQMHEKEYSAAATEKHLKFMAGINEYRNSSPEIRESFDTSLARLEAAIAARSKHQPTVDAPAEAKPIDPQRTSIAQLLNSLQEKDSNSPVTNMKGMQEDTGKSSVQMPVACTESTDNREQADENSAYITRHNFRKISTFYLQPDGNISIDKIFSVIYDRDLSEVLNQKEAVRLYVQKQAMEKKFSSIRVEKRAFSKKYAFSVAPPKFHKKRDCPFITADFSNYLVPPAIEALGEDKVKEFQEYCEAHRKKFDGKPDDVFWAHVGIRFNVHISPEKVLYGNSGISDVEKIGVDELHKSINETISQLLSLIGNTSKASALTNLRYAPNIKIALSSVQDEKAKEEISEFFRLKAGLANYLFELYKKQAGYNSYILPMTLLKACGLEPCKGCCV